MDIVCAKIDTSIYNAEVYLIIGDSGKAVGQYINTKFEGNIDKVEEDDKCRGYQWKTYYPAGNGYEKGRFFVYINTMELTPNNTTLDHETIHLTWDILTHVGIIVDAENHEAFTYLYEHLIKQCREVVDDTLNKPKKLKRS
jgi:hypothetical protein